MSRASVDDKRGISAACAHTDDAAFDGAERELTLPFALIALEIRGACSGAG